MSLVLSASLRERLETIADVSVVARLLLDDTAVVDNFGNHLTLRKDGSISYMPKGKDQAKGEKGRWVRDGRQSGRPARIARRFIAPDAIATLKDADFELFANKIKARAALFAAPQLLKGDDVAYWYDERRYHDDSGSLNNSCMRDAPPRHFDLYAKNPNVISLLTLIDDDRLHARALVWETDRGPLMDRVYGKDDVIEGFADYAAEHGWWHRRNGDDGPYVRDEDARTDPSFTVPLDYIEEEYASLPSLDTFAYFAEPNKLTNDSDGSTYYYTKLYHTIYGR